MNTLILIIDDSPTIRAILAMTARREGYAARCFPDGYMALRWLVSLEGQMPALIFLDLTMPRMDGFTVLRHLKSKPALAAVPVIVLTSREINSRRDWPELASTRANRCRRKRLLPSCTSILLSPYKQCCLALLTSISIRHKETDHDQPDA